MGRKKKIKPLEEEAANKNADSIIPQQEETKIQESVDVTVTVTKLSIGEGKVKRRMQKMIEMRDNDGIGNL